MQEECLAKTCGLILVWKIRVAMIESFCGLHPYYYGAKRGLHETKA